MTSKPFENAATALGAEGYIADETLALAVDLALQLARPLLLEGDAGVGKTEVAASLARALGARLIRLQCYEGLDASAAIYEWNYQRQLLAIRASERFAENAAEIEDHIFSPDFLLERPLLQAIRQPEPPVLLIDEIDRADEEFEAFLLEVLADYQVTVPELGTMKATSIPHVILTSNRTRDLSDALRRRCLYAFVDYPGPEREAAIICARLPGIDAALAGHVARFVGALRREDLEKRPGIAETLDWCAALMGLGIERLEAGPDRLRRTLICLLKTEADTKAVSDDVTGRLVAETA